MKLNELYEVKKKDIKLVSSDIAKAFKNAPSFNYILEERQELKYFQRIIKYIIKYNVLYSSCYASSSELEGVICFSQCPDYGHGFLKSIRAGTLSLSTLGSKAGKRGKKYDEFKNKKHKEIIQEPHIYIELLGVNPKYQGFGYGGKLLSAVLEKATQQGYPCYLETNLKKNVSFYESFGFETMASLLIPNTEISHYCMLYRE